MSVNKFMALIFKDYFHVMCFYTDWSILRKP